MPAPVVPAWVAQATASVQQPTSKAYQIQLPSGQQVQAMGQQLLQSIVQGIMQVLDGFITPGIEPTEQLSQWNTETQNALTALQTDFGSSSAAFTTLLSSWWTAIQDYTTWSTFIAALESAWNTYTTTVTGLESDELFTIQQLLNSLFGIDSSTGQTAAAKVASSNGLASLEEDWTNWLDAVSSTAGTPGPTSLAGATSGLQLITNTLQGLSSKVQNQLTGAVGASQSGKSYQVFFGNYPSGAFSGAPFNITYGPIPGSGLTAYGTGDLTLASGDAVWNAVNNGDVSVFALYNGGGASPVPTDTDYQELQASLAGYPNGAGSKNFAVLRANSTGDTYVYGLVYLNTSYELCWEIGCYVAGTHTVFDSGVGAPLNLNFTFVAGVGGNPYRFQGISGDEVIFDYTDSSMVSQVGSSHRCWGFRSDTYNNGQIYPAPASYVGCADNAPPTLVGSGFRQYSSASSTTMSHASSTQYQFPTGFFDTTAEATPDWTFNTVPGLTGVVAATAANAGWYNFDARCNMTFAASLGMVSISLGIQRYSSSGTLEETLLLPGVGVAYNVDTIQSYTSHFGGNGGIYMNAGDSIVPFYWIDGPGTASSLTFVGDATGAQTWWAMRLANLSLA